MAESGSVGTPITGWRGTGVGSLPGTDPFEAAAGVADGLPDWPHLPELPARGPGADMVGRAMHLLTRVSAEFAVETAAAGWRRIPAPGLDMRRAGSLFAADCEAVEQRFAGYSGPFTVPIAGPWTLAASVTDEWGERTLRDRGYVADLCNAHGEAAAGLVSAFRRILPAAQIIIAVDEPALAAVHDGEIPFSSGYRRHRAVPSDELVSGLRPTCDAVRAVGGAFALHTCARPVWSVIHDLRPDHLSLDVSLLGESDTEPFGIWLESGAGTVWGVWPASGPAGPDETDEAYGAVIGWLRRLGMDAARMPGASAVSPRCGLAGATTAQALAAMAGVREVARRLGESSS